jgi:hypothetical protein
LLKEESSGANWAPLVPVFGSVLHFFALYNALSARCTIEGKVSLTLSNFAIPTLPEICSVAPEILNGRARLVTIWLQGNCVIDTGIEIKNDRKFVTAKPGGEVRTTKSGLDAGANLLKEFVARRMAMSVIDRFEPIQIDQGERVATSI